MSRGRDPDFIYATNSARPGSDFMYTDTGAVSITIIEEMSAMVKTISALRALVLQTLLRPMREF